MCHKCTVTHTLMPFEQLKISAAIAWSHFLPTSPFMLTSYFYILTDVITVPHSNSWLSMPLYVVAVVHFVILPSSSRSLGKGMLCARSGLRTATVRGNDYHGEGWYHRFVQFYVPQWNY